MNKFNKKRPQTREVNPPKYTKTTKAEHRQNTGAGGSYVDKLLALRDFNAHALFASLGRLLASPFGFFMTISVLAIAISLASGFYLLKVNLQQLTQHLEASTRISLFLREEVSELHAAKLLETIKAHPKVQQATLIDKEQGLEEFKTYSGFGAAISALKTNPLPVVIEVLPKNSLTNKQDLEALLHEFQQSQDVDMAQMDMQWLERLQSIVCVGETTATLFNLMLAFAVVFITANTIRLELNNRREEVIIAKLVGATDMFIQTPFLYAGLWIGLISGIVAWFLVTAMMVILRPSVEALSALYGGHFHLLFFSFAETFKLLAISTLLGVAGSWGVLVYQLRDTQPE